MCTCLIVANVLTYSLNFWRDISLWVGWVNQCLKCFTSSWFVTWPSFISMYCLTDSRENSVWKLAILKILSLLNCSTFFHSYGYVYYWNSLTIRILNFLLMSLWFCHFVMSVHKSTPKSLRPSGLMEASRFECGSNCSDPELTFPAPAPYPSGPPWGLMSDIWTTAGSLPPRPPRPTRISSSKLWKQQQKIYHPRLISLESS